jgi:hypothetical protein
LRPFCDEEKQAASEGESEKIGQIMHIFRFELDLNTSSDHFEQALFCLSYEINGQFLPLLKQRQFTCNDLGGKREDA